MKAFLVLIVGLLSLSALASTSNSDFATVSAGIPLPPQGTQPGHSVQKEATKEERALICDAIEQYTKENGTDFALDYKACVSNTTITSEFFSTILVTDVFLLKGSILFHAPDRPSYLAKCKTTYFGAAKVKNLIGGTETGIVCE